MNQLQTYFDNNPGNCINKWLHYFDVYEFWFKKYKNKPIVILEIGIYQGGSLQMWRNYFGERAQIYAIDINPSCKQFESKNTHIYIGSQEDRDFLQTIRKKIPKIDILIDDGGHTMKQQIVTFEEFFNHIKDDGLYFCEDTHTSYWANYGGGFKRSSSFIEYTKKLVDQLNAWHSREKKLTVNGFTRSTDSIHFYDSIVVIQKKKRVEPVSKMKGSIVIPTENFPIPASKKTIINKFFSKLERLINNR